MAAGPGASHNDSEYWHLTGAASNRAFAELSRLRCRRADSLPRTNSGSDRAPALAPAGASGPAPAQRLGERPVVPGQVRHLPVELRDLPPQGFDLPPQGLDLRGLLPAESSAARGRGPHKQGGAASPLAVSGEEKSVVACPRRSGL